MMSDKPEIRGFTLVELLVSVGITAILMVGLSTFFSSTFRNMFMAREQVTSTQEEFVVNTILNGKFAHALSVDPSSGCAPDDCAVLRNDMNTGDLPFTYVGKATVGSTERIVFKDFFVFNGREGTLASQSASGIENPGGLTVLGSKAYVAAPLEDDIYSCSAVLTGCAPLDIPGLDQPIDVTSNGSDDILYVTDAGSGRILKITNPSGSQTISEVTTGLNYPTGIAYYGSYLFVSDTYNHLVKKVRISDGLTTVAAGNGDDTVCDFDGRDHTASFCKLSFPTGLLVADDGSGEALYIADTGNGRVLKVSDPGAPANQGTFERILFTFGGQYAVEKIAFGDFSDETFLDSTMTDDLNAEYDEGTHEMNLNPLFVAYENPGPPCNWSLSGPNIYLDVTDEIEQVEIGDIISSEGTTYEITYRTDPGDRLLCSDGTPPDPDDRAHQLEVVPDVSGILPGSDIYFGSVDQAEETIDLEFADISFSSSGFQPIDINVYEFGNATPVESHQYIVRVGDGELGTSEDTISKVADYDYPTGLGWNGASVVPSETADYLTDFSNTNYNYVSDFAIQGFVFSEPITDRILELYFKAMIGEDSEGNPAWEENTLNANISG